jgi:hypothetical protein
LLVTEAFKRVGVAVVVHALRASFGLVV